MRCKHIDIYKVTNWFQPPCVSCVISQIPQDQPCQGVNTLRPRQNGRRFAADTFKRIFFNENIRISIKISLKFVPKGSINNNPALVQIMAWRRSGDKPLSEPMMVSLLMHICVTRPQWVKNKISQGILWDLCCYLNIYTCFNPESHILLIRLSSSHWGWIRTLTDIYIIDLLQSFEWQLISQ